jgi:hypothetical protein
MPHRAFIMIWNCDMMHMPVFDGDFMATEWNISRPLSKTEIPHLTMHQCSAVDGTYGS